MAILDEADRMLDAGFEPQSKRIVELAISDYSFSFFPIIINDCSLK